MSKFRELPTEWSFHGVLQSVAPGRTKSGADYRFDNPHMGRFITEQETSNVLFVRSRSLQFGHPAGWN